MKKITLTHKPKPAKPLDHSQSSELNVSVRQPILDNDIQMSIACIQLCFGKCPGPWFPALRIPPSDWNSQLHKYRVRSSWLGSCSAEGIWSCHVSNQIVLRCCCEKEKSQDKASSEVLPAEHMMQSFLLCSALPQPQLSSLLLQERCGSIEQNPNCSVVEKTWPVNKNWASWVGVIQPEEKIGGISQKQPPDRWKAAAKRDRVGEGGGQEFRVLNDSSKKSAKTLKKFSSSRDRVPLG